MEGLNKNNKYWIFAVVLVVILACFAMMMGYSGGAYKKFGNEQKNTLSVSGHGEVNAVPDIANINFTIRKEAKTVKEAQDEVAKIEKKVLELFKTNSISSKDIKANSVSFNPKYEYRYGGTCNQYNCPGKSVIIGYEAYENISVKIRNIDDTGKITQGLGEQGVTELNGPSFAIDKEDSLKTEARKKAIADAKAKAKVLAKDLGVRLGDITSFSESGNYPTPMYEADFTGGAMKAMSAQAPAELPKGENTISSDVTIVYEMK